MPLYLINNKVLEFAFFQRALLGIVLISVALAITGVYVMSRRMVFISGGITHACFGGLGLGYFLGVSPIAMAAVFAVGGSLGVEWLSKNGKVRSDSAIAVIWAVGMALGVLFIFLSSGFVPQLNTFLFGNVLTVSYTDIYIFTAFTLVLAAFFLLFHKTVVSVSFDQSFARVNHMPVTFVNVMMTLFVSLAIVLSIRMVGIMMLMSLLSLPQMIAETRCSRYNMLVLWSMIISVTGSVGGLFISAFLGVPASATIVLLLAVMFLAAKILPHHKNS